MNYDLPYICKDSHTLLIFHTEIDEDRIEDKPKDFIMSEAMQRLR